MNFEYLFYLLIPVIGYFGYKHNVRGAHKALIADGDYVIVSSTSLARDIKLLRKRVKNADIVKIQVSNSCISLFNPSDNAIDIWLPNKKAVNTVANKASKLFKSAKVVNLCS